MSSKTDPLAATLSRARGIAKVIAKDTRRVNLPTTQAELSLAIFFALQRGLVVLPPAAASEETIG
jgi:hypothetical protein